MVSMIRLFRESNNSSPESAGCESSLWEVYHAPSHASSLPFTAQPGQIAYTHSGEILDSDLGSIPSKLCLV